MPWFLPDGRLIFATRRYDHFPTRWKLAVAHRDADGSWEWNAFIPPPLTSEDGNAISPAVWHDTLFFASDRRGGRGGYDLYAFPLCGPVTVVLHSNSPILAARTTVTVSGSDGLERRWEAAPAELRFAARAFQHYTVQVHQPCRPPVEVRFQPPCDFSHSVVYHQTISLPKTFVVQTAVLPLPGNTAYRPLTTEHAWAGALQWSFQLRPTP
ncbi:MAG: hypothetical protein NZ960_08230 [Candidatus Kapabacteria bacterium]|nr:hypothetical protein [Candidatus Kapabacteria bacterium]MDW8012441.1 hypothetical protein [Bacteroidota bacterium]